MKENESLPLSKREHKKNVNRENIINAAIQLFSSQPYSEVSMRAIAKRANVSPGLIYKYFEDQQHLFMVAFQIESSHFLRVMHETMKQQPDNLYVIAREYVQYMYEHDNLYKMMTFFMLESEQHPIVTDGLREVTDELFELFRAALSNHLPEERLKSTAQLFFSSLNGILITYKNLPGRSKEISWNHIEHLVGTLIDVLKGR
ncbi:TetR/AcrR family transcriptional regulator [Brevibacillus sp. SYSU BS000544]|uniref:TetR/AcrR family transcriptional regulator n=1 Tax=Brevibacillus sp. SYSU BS000544 TaxID=3416443 RepID=UPI003CE4CB38